MEPGANMRWGRCLFKYAQRSRANQPWVLTILAACACVASPNAVPFACDCDDGLLVGYACVSWPRSEVVGQSSVGQPLIIETNNGFYPIMGQKPTNDRPVYWKSLVSPLPLRSLARNIYIYISLLPGPANNAGLSVVGSRESARASFRRLFAEHLGRGV